MAELLRTLGEGLKILHLTIADERAPGWNKTLRLHWVKRQELVDAVWYRILSGLAGMAWQLMERPVDIRIVATFKGPALDSDNICAKLYIDALKGRLLHDDDGRWVRRVTTESRRGKVNQVDIWLMEIEG